jgi:hypothetical protein
LPSAGRARRIVTKAAQRSTSWAPAIVLTIVLVAVQATVFFGLRAGDARLLFDTAELAPSLEIYGDRTLSQTFIAQADGLSAITVYPSPQRRPATGRVDLTLEDDAQTPIVRATVAAADLVGRAEWTWRFPPVEASARRRFRLRVALPDAAEGSGLSLATGPPTAFGGTLTMGVRPQWGHLQFQTRSEHARVVDLLQRRPTVRHGAWLAVAACAAMVLLATSLSALTLGLIRDGALD